MRDEKGARTVFLYFIPHPSFNGVSTGGWIEYASLIEEAGADALELNVYFIPASAELTGEAVGRVLSAGPDTAVALPAPSH